MMTVGKQRQQPVEMREFSAIPAERNECLLLREAGDGWRCYPSVSQDIAVDAVGRWVFAQNHQFHLLSEVTTRRANFLSRRWSFFFHVTLHSAYLGRLCSGACVRARRVSATCLEHPLQVRVQVRCLGNFAGEPHRHDWLASLNAAPHYATTESLRLKDRRP